ncbi:ATP-binding protein [Salinisphaera sp. SPP-AMP-43]|uniref:sensor histidine kinase n=1 Tax=Salinisphaera sp. SPP-AMP-43 TaxID=3121288 RepID=UPI003C6DD7D8
MKPQQTIAPTGASWRAALTLALYRSAVAFGLVAVLSAGANLDHGLFDPSLARAFRILSLIYLALALGQAGTALVRWPQPELHIVAQILVDSVLLLGLSYTGNGAAGGPAMLLLAPLTAAGILLPGRRAALFAATATLGLLSQEILRHWQLDTAHTDFMQSGILGALYLATTWMAYGLAHRVRASDASAASHANQARDLAELNHRIIERMQTGAIVIDAEGRIQTANQAAVDLIEHAPEQPPLTHAEALPPALLEALVAWQTRAKAAEIVEIAGRPLQPSFSSLGGDDTTTLVFLEDALRASRQAQQMKLISLGRLTARIAHEIRNPLGAISHAGQLLAESEALGTEDQRLLRMIHRHCRRIDRIVDDVLGLARRSAQQPKTLVLGPWLAEAIDDYRDSRSNPPALRFETDPPETTIRFDPEQLRQVLFNLWDNSHRHARGQAAPTISIRWHLDNNRNMALDIADNGPGIPEDVLDRVLEPFFTTAAEGTGLGLHIARELCEANGARLLPISGRAAGACFRILLPRVPPDQDSLPQ